MHDNDYQRRTDRYLALLRRHENTLFWLCGRHARFSPDRMPDLLQDVRERIWRTLDTLRPDATAHEERRWVRWQAFSVFGKDRRRKAPPALSLDAIDTLPDDDNTHAMLMLLDELLALLPDDDRRLLQALCQGVTPEEIAAAEHQALHTVQNRISIARQHLRQVNEQYNKNDI